MKRPPIRAVLDGSASVAMIVASVVLVWFAFNARATQPAPSGGPAPGYRVSERVPEVPGVDFSTSEKSLLVYLRSTCKFCTASMAFYREIASASRSARVIVASNEPVGVVNAYLDEHGFKADQVISIPPGLLKVSGTPTLLLVDRDRVVQKVWTGQLRERDQERALLAAIN